MDIKKLKKELGLSNKELAEFFGMSYNAYANSSAKERYERALCRLYAHVLLGGKLDSVSNQRELLVAYNSYLFGEYEGIDFDEQDVTDFLEINNA
jgi:transcriptional regulator with XRE-family HTH domain